jgi:hypothetical protein
LVISTVLSNVGPILHLANTVKINIWHKFI